MSPLYDIALTNSLFHTHTIYIFIYISLLTVGPLMFVLQFTVNQSVDFLSINQPQQPIGKSNLYRSQYSLRTHVIGISTIKKVSTFFPAGNEAHLFATKRLNYPSVYTLVKRIVGNGNGNASMYEMTCAVY